MIKNQENSTGGHQEKKQDGADDFGDVYDNRDSTKEELLEKIDAYSFRIFPIIFVLSNIPYWAYYETLCASTCAKL